MRLLSIILTVFCICIFNHCKVDKKANAISYYKKQEGSVAQAVSIFKDLYSSQPFTIVWFSEERASISHNNKIYSYEDLKDGQLPASFFVESEFDSTRFTQLTNLLLECELSSLSYNEKYTIVSFGKTSSFPEKDMCIAICNTDYNCIAYEEYLKIDSGVYYIELLR